MKYAKGFTLIELIIVIVIIGVLSAVALPRFLNLTDDANSAKARNIAISFQTGINLVRSQYLLMRTGSSQLDIDVNGVTDLSFNAEGYPTGAYTDSAIQPLTASAAACLAFWNFVVDSGQVVLSTTHQTNVESIVPTNSATGCQYDYYVSGSDTCLTHIQYTQSNGQVSMSSCATGADISLH